MFPKIPVSQDPKGAGEGPWRGRGGAEAREAGEIGEAGEAMGRLERLMFL